MFVVSETSLGTSEKRWLSAPQWDSCPPLSWGPPGRVMVIAPHPDDEVLALGGSMFELTQAGFTVDVMAVTDGEGSHPQSPTLSPAELVVRRAEERARALSRLGVGAEVLRLGVPDGGVAKEEALARSIAERLDDVVLCLAPWHHDGHPDHDATGIAAVQACLVREVQLLQYPVWAWHWAHPEHERWPWPRICRVPLGESALQAKCTAIEAYRSQIIPLGPAAGDEAVLPAPVLARFRRPFEVLFR